MGHSTHASSFVGLCNMLGCYCIGHLHTIRLLLSDFLGVAQCKKQYTRALDKRQYFVIIRDNFISSAQKPIL